MLTRGVRLRMGVLAAACAVLLGVGGCDDSFSIYGDSNRYFSIFGYLDAARQTQWMRVEALRDSVFIGTDSAEVRVTLKNLATNEVETLREEIRAHGSFIVRNFWTRMDIRPGATYRLEVEHLRDGATSWADVTIPEHAPEIQAGANAITVHGIERLGALQVVYSYERFTGEVSLLADTTRLASGAYRVAIVGSTLPPEAQLLSVTAASVSEDWPEYVFPVGNSDPLPPVGIDSNVEHGVGYVGGAITRTVLVQ